MLTDRRTNKINTPEVSGRPGEHVLGLSSDRGFGELLEDVRQFGRNLDLLGAVVRLVRIRHRHPSCCTLSTCREKVNEETQGFSKNGNSVSSVKDLHCAPVLAFLSPPVELPTFYQNPLDLDLPCFFFFFFWKSENCSVSLVHK